MNTEPDKIQINKKKGTFTKFYLMPMLFGMLTGGSGLFLFNSFTGQAEKKTILATGSDFATPDAAQALARQLSNEQSDDWQLQVNGITQIPDPEHIEIVRSGLMAGKRTTALCMVSLTDESTPADYQVALALAKGETRAVCIPHWFQIQHGGQAALQLDTQGLLPMEVRVAGIRLDVVRSTWG